MRTGKTYETNTTPESSTHAVSNLETITDNGEPMYRNNYNEVTHTRHFPLLFEVPAASAKVEEGTSCPYYPGAQTLELALQAGYYLASPAAYPPYSLPSIDWNGLVSQVGESLDGHMTTKSNILVTIGEGLKTIAMLKNPLTPLRVLTRSKSIREVVNGVAGLHLVYKYGWKQLYRDIVAFGDVHNRVSDHIAYLQKSKGKFRSLSATQTDTTSIGDDTEITHSFYKSIFRLSHFDRRATFSCQSRLDDSIDIHNRLRFTLQALGVDRVTEAVWDLVPFSFVIDWLINWRSFAKDPRTKFQNHHVRRLGYSVKEEWYCIPIFEYDRPPFTTGGPRLQASSMGSAQIVQSAYSRTPGFPPGSETAGVFSSLSITNLVDGAALILQRI
jgi:hypothetical protein